NAKNHELPENPLAAWSDTYLYNQIFIDEYRKMSRLFESSSDFRKRNSGTDFGFEVWRRAKFSIKNSRMLRQVLGGMRGLSNSPLWYENEPGKWKNGTSGPDLSFKSVLGGFEKREDREIFSSLEISYIDAKFPCGQMRDRIDEFKAFQIKTVSEGKMSSSENILVFLKNWKEKEIMCLAVNLVNRDTASADHIDPLYLLKSLENLKIKGGEKLQVKVLTAVYFIKNENYAEALRILFDLQNIDRRYRLSYELTQKIFNYHQRGQGEVALKQL
ncbi:MAG: hypothetical protein HQK54_14360, partial [Oligoflexales bacterium]|nr:hypothetical protein [Oligoflexales bacterium]